MERELKQKLDNQYAAMYPSKGVIALKIVFAIAITAIIVGALWAWNVALLERDMALFVNTI